MNKRILRAVLMILTALLLTGCGQHTVEQMYSLPKRSQEYNHLQSAIDTQMQGREYSAPRSGEHQQTVQMADLDGDGKEEYLVFAKGSSEKPMQILIFHLNDHGEAELMEVIESTGSAFEQVEYVDMDDKPGCELVVGRLLSEQVPRSVSVYTFHSGYGEQLMATGYSRFITCDLDDNGQSELLLIQHGESDTGRAVVTLFRYKNGDMHRSREMELSNEANSVKRMNSGKLQDETPAIYVTSTDEFHSVITDIFTLREEQFIKVSFDLETEQNLETLRNYDVHAEDIDDDGIVELPSLISMRSLYPLWETEQQYLIRWYSLDLSGQVTNKLYSFHNYSGGWFLTLDENWANRIALDHQENTYVFYIWSEDFQEALPVFSVYVLTGSEQDTQAAEQNRFILHQGDDVVYACKLGMASGIYGITEDQLMNSFHLIYQDWKSGET